MQSRTNARAVFELGVIWLRLGLMAVAAMAFFSLLMLLMFIVFIGISDEGFIKSFPFLIWNIAAILVAGFNYSLMWYRIDYGEWRNLVVYAATSASIVLSAFVLQQLYSTL